MLVTLDEVKTFLGISLSDTSQDALITMFKESVEQSIINFCETDFQETVETGELHDGLYADIITPNNIPILSVQGVFYNVDVNGSGGTQLDSSRDYYHDENVIKLRIDTPFDGRGNIRIDYTYGYESVPADVKMAVYQSVKAELQRYKSNTENITSRSKKDESEGYGSAWDSKTGLPKQIISKLQSYRIYEFPGGGMAQRNR